MAKAKKKENFISSFLWIVLLALLFRSFLFTSYNIPTGSMINTLKIGDYIFASKWTYGYSKHSLPFSIPIIPNKIFSKTPNRGDIVVFKTPEDNRTDYIKRVIGLPGDKIKIINGDIIINETPILKKRTNDFIDNDKKSSMNSIQT